MTLNGKNDDEEEKEDSDEDVDTLGRVKALRMFLFNFFICF